MMESRSSRQAVTRLVSGPEAVDRVMVNGTWIMRDRRILAFDEAAILAEATGLIVELKEKTEAGRVALDTALPRLSEYFRANG